MHIPSTVTIDLHTSNHINLEPIAYWLLLFENQTDPSSANCYHPVLIHSSPEMSRIGQCVSRDTITLLPYTLEHNDRGRPRQERRIHYKNFINILIYTIAIICLTVISGRPITF